ncbi:Surface layer protein [uncultured Clostridium sp.]|nr:Surface layer protein [uncultured Clostridium sp.]
MKKEVAALSLALALTVGMTVPASAAGGTFADVPAEHWAYAAVEEMVSRGVVSGVGENCYAPDNTVSYAEFATMIARSFYGDKIGTGGEAWYSAFLDTVTQAGAVKGTRLEQDPALAVEGITRYDMAQVMYNVMSEKGADIPGDFDTTQIGDWSAIPVGYQKAVSDCYSLGTLSGTDGKGTFSGNSVMTRAQAAVVMDRLLEVCSGGTPSTPEVPETPGEIPADAKPITQLTQLTSKKGLEAYGNGFHTDAGSITYGYATFGTATKGYSVLTLTVRAGDKDVSVYSNVGLIGQNPYEPGEHRGTEIIKAGETRTIEFDVSGSQSCGLSFEDAESEFDGQFAECWITDIYLY